MKILVIIPYIFLPPVSGNQNLLSNLLKYVANEIYCDLILLVNSDTDITASKAAIRRVYPNIGNIIIFTKPRGISLLLAMFQAFANGYHPALGRYHNKLLINWLSKNVVKGGYDLIHFDMFHTAPYRKFCKDTPTLLVSSDAYSMAAQNAGTLSRKIKTRLRSPIETTLLKNFEKNEYSKFNMVCTVSEVDAKYLQSVASPIEIKTIGIALDPAFSERKITHLNTKPEKKILCTGNLDHAIISDGIIEFLKRDLVSIRKFHPDVKVTILGKNPTVELKRCIEITDRVKHVDFVDHYDDFLDQDWVYVYPQKCATGLQTKLQQALSLALPVVGYKVSFGGLMIKSGTHCYVCNNSDDLVRHVLSLISDVRLRREIGLNAATHIRENFSINKVGTQMVEIYKDIIKHYKSVE